MSTYLDILNRARARQGGSALNAVTAATGTSGDALIGIQAVNEALAEVYNNSVDLDLSEKLATVSTSVGVSQITSPSGNDTWNAQLIHNVQYQDSSTSSWKKLILVPFERAKELEYYIASVSDNRPLFWYVNQGNVFILPTPTAIYTLQVFYHGLLPTVDNSTMSSTITLPRDFEDAFVSLTYSFLRRSIGDPGWEGMFEGGKQKLKRALVTNKHLYKRKGWRKVQMACNYADRSL